MTKEELASLATELKKCGAALVKIAASLEVPAQAVPPKTPEAPTLTLEEVRKVAADKSRQGFTNEVRELIQKYGADKLSTMDPENYGAFLQGLEVMGHAG
ncbi:rRNA biogenesis protein rrp5 [Acidaminococcus sp. LBK-2]|uniref:rRNA biogenesis protein rrp5 n=1 Tax=Acidaminococcus sp. LBK-2 TaxID=3456956 RepID=UPI003FA4C66A